VASTYAAILAVVNIGTEEAYSMVDVEGMNSFLKSVKNNLKFINSDSNLWHLQDPNTE
jgi:hypothetical protein